jgi:ubiquinone/menaquinone biosynthesis C-methylase UbiE
MKQKSEQKQPGKGSESMPTPAERHKNEQPSTYFVQDRHNEEELVRLTIQDQMITAAMGGVLPEQADPLLFRRVLDVGCGTGGWIIEAAQKYPTLLLEGIDISQHMIEYAREQAAALHIADRVTFHVMDALRMLEFPAAFFDLVNLRFGISFVRTWDWPKMLREMLRVTRAGGWSGSPIMIFCTRVAVLRWGNWTKLQCVPYSGQDTSLPRKGRG